MMKRDLLTNYPELLAEWDYEKNILIGLEPNKVSRGCHKKAFWKCKQGHSWEAIISNRIRLGRSCPYCTHQLPIPGETDLFSTHPELKEEWNYKKNIGLDPLTIMPGTHKKVWWKCKLGHEWKAEVKSRTTGIGCPNCSGKVVKKGYNDLKTVNPELAAEWNYEKNGGLTPEMVTKSSGIKVWWKCPNEHEYEAKIDNRAKGRGCPKCSSAMRTSFPEQAIYYYVKQIFPDAINSYKDIFRNSMELDIFIPSLNIGIEYDGKVYHSEKHNIVRDGKKYAICKTNGIKLIRVVESKHYVPVINCDKKIEIPSAKDVYLNSAIIQVCMMLGSVPNVNVKRDRNSIKACLDKRKFSLAKLYPELAKEWNYDKNSPMKPEQFAPHANEKVWWKCNDCGNEWIAAIGDRTRPDATGCPQCALKNGAEKRVSSIIANKGSAADLAEDVLLDWDYSRNTFLPSEITKGSSKKVAWKCHVCGYEWESTISKKLRGNSCSACSNRVVIVGRNDLATLRPDLLKDWDYSKNTIKPDEVTLGTGKRAYWKCHMCGYEWSAVIGSRVKGAGCSNCYRMRRRKLQK